MILYAEVSEDSGIVAISESIKIEREMDKNNRIVKLKEVPEDQKNDNLAQIYVEINKDGHLQLACEYKDSLEEYLTKGSHIILMQETEFE